ncbi:MAG: trimethylamine methyltransferase family protein [Pseudomonadota bacterium]
MPRKYALLDETALVAIEAQAAQILSEIGVELQEDSASLDAFRSIGARCERQRVYPDASQLRELIAQAPNRFVWHGKTDAASVEIGGSRPIIAPVFGPPKVLDKSGETHLGTLQDYRDLVRFCDQSDAMDSTGFLLCIAHGGGLAVPHMELLKAHMELSDKPMMGTVISEAALRDIADAVGASLEQCRLLHMVNLTPPLTYQVNPLRCLRASAELGQGTVVSSYMMMGATSPVMMAGALAQGLAEILVGLALTQIYRPGAPVVGGIFATPFSMQFMGPVFGTPESHLVQLAACQLIRRLGIPVRGDGMISSSKLNDAQAGYEGAGVLGASLLGGADLILHSAGWLEAGRLVSLEKCQTDMAWIEQVLPVYSEAAV